jgi:hypothetical protein
MPMYAYSGGVVWNSGFEGGYLVLGNMVYTVSWAIFIYDKHSLIVN